ncbi:phage head closure protein [Pseudomonas syringae]|uniref:phage head closure protein n=1 Tax=Pseudomonas syringae TaxID=317 RepID=UPI003F78FDD1
MRAGDLRHRVTLQKQVTAQDQQTGAMLPATWVDFATVWASVEALSARDLIAAQGVQSEVVARIVIRYRPGVDATMRALHRGRIYNIHGALPDAKSGLEYLTLPVSEGLNNG